MFDADIVRPLPRFASIMRNLSLQLTVYLIDNYNKVHTVLRMVFTFNISNIKKEGGFNIMNCVQIMWCIQFLPLSAPPKL